MKNALALLSTIMLFGAVLVLYAAVFGLAFGVMYESAMWVIEGAK
jgi:hypothetical protein